MYTYTTIHAPLESAPENISFLHDPVIQRIALWFARFFIALSAIGIVLYVLTLVLHIVIDLVQTMSTLVHTLIAPFMHANPAGQLILIIAVLALGYASLRYIVSGRKRGVA